MSSKNRTVGVAYVPVLHKGYQNFFAALESAGVSELYLFGDEILAAHEELDYLNRKDRLRAVPVAAMAKAIAATGTLHASELTHEVIENLQTEATTVITPREDIGKLVVSQHFKEHTVEYVDIFLRWHRDNTGEEQAVAGQSTITPDSFQRDVLQAVQTEASNAVDWWRQVGAALVKDGELLYVTHNEHLPERELPNILGDTRALFKRGININYVTSAHAEVVAIAEAAKRGIATEGAELYVTDFPCPYCARLIAKSGIKKLYFMNGYAVLDGDNFLKEEGVEVIRVAKL